MKIVSIFPVIEKLLASKANFYYINQVNQPYNCFTTIYTILCLIWNRNDKIKLVHPRI